MHFVTQLRRLFSIFLLTTILLVSTVGSGVNTPAFAATGASNEISNVKGETKNINGSYRKLREATQDSWDKFEDEQALSGKRSGGKSARSLNQPKQAIENINQNTKNAFQRTADSIKDGLSSN